LETFIARQPIFDSRNRVLAYELLFRHGPENWFHDMDPEQATSQVILNSAGLFNLSILTGGRSAFINLTRQLLLDGAVRLLPPDQVVVEVLEDVEPDEKVVAALRCLKQEGYRIALDDLTSADDQKPLHALADFVKIDLLATGAPRAAEIIRKLGRPRLRFLAEKVETWADFQEAKDMGFHSYQGFYFERPEVISQTDIPHNKHIALRLIQEVRKANLDFAILEGLIKEDLALSYRLLRLVNSAWAGLPKEILSVSHAMVMIGERRVRQLVQMVALGHMGQDGSEELIQRSFVRAHFLEKLAERVGLNGRSDEFYFMGLFTWIDTLLNKNMSDILDLLPVSDNARLALLDRQGQLGQALKLCDAIEAGDWESFDHIAVDLDQDPGGASENYIQSMGEVYRIQHAIGTPTPV
jgi:c-di-GMP-related signal transduction protein